LELAPLLEAAGADDVLVGFEQDPSKTKAATPKINVDFFMMFLPVVI